jgi:membrane protein implicated in regulation of membrane protease activity
MRLEFLTGLLLVLALLGALVYIFKELFSTMRLDLSKFSLSDAFGQQRSTDPAPINAHLVGMRGDVVRVNDDGDRPLTVRLGLERWPARLEAGDSEAGVPSVGDSVVVTAVAGPVLIVRFAE